jgi:SRSO17 transposase
MDISQILKLKPKLKKYLKRFDHCFPRKDTRAHLPTYISGQLSDIPEKSVEPIAINPGVAPRTLQEFLSQHHWDHDQLRDELQKIVRDDHSGPHSIGVIDETSDIKKGDKTPGVQRQWCGSQGKKENCLVTVHLGYAREGFHCLIDGELYLPESWSNDRPRCREAGIPDSMVYRPKWKISLELYDHAIKNGIHFDWMTYDEGYRSKPGFLRGLNARNQKFVGEVPRSFTGWLKPPRIITRAFHKNGRGRGRKIPRLASGSRPVQRVEAMLEEPAFRDQVWKRWRIKDGKKGPMIWEVKHALFHPKDEDEMPGQAMHLVVARNVLDPKQVKFFVSNAPPETPVSKLLLVGFSRWRVERCFEDQKSEIGLDQYEGRRYQGLKRHLVLSCVSYLFLSRMREEFGGGKSRVDGVPGAHGNRVVDPELVAGATAVEEVVGTNVCGDQANAEEKRVGLQEPHQGDAKEVASLRHQAHRSSPLRLGVNLAL